MWKRTKLGTRGDNLHKDLPGEQEDEEVAGIAITLVTGSESVPTYRMGRQEEPWIIKEGNKCLHQCFNEEQGSQK